MITTSLTLKKIRTPNSITRINDEFQLLNKNKLYSNVTLNIDNSTGTFTYREDSIVVNFPIDYPDTAPIFFINNNQIPVLSWSPEFKIVDIISVVITNSSKLTV